MVFTGGLGLVIIGIIAGVIMPWIYSIVSLPTMGLLALSAKALEKNIILGSILLFIGSFWEKSIDWFWITLVFYYFTSQNNHFHPLALILVAYATTMAPFQYMASHENAINGSEGLGTTLGLFYAQIVFLILVCSWLLNFSPVGLLWIVTLLITAIPVYIVVKAKKSAPKEVPEYAQSKDESIAINAGLISNKVNPSHSKVDLDALVDRALTILEDYDNVSASLLQKRMYISYEVSSQLIEELEKIGAISVSNPPQPRKVLFHDTDYDPLLNEALFLCKEYEKVSRSLFQRRLAIDYLRATKIFSQLRRLNIISHEQFDNSQFGEVHVGIVDKKALEKTLNMISEGEKGKAKTTNKTESKITNSKSEMIKIDAMIIEKTLEAFGVRTRLYETNIKKNGIEYCLEIELGTSIVDLPKFDKDIALAVASPTGRVTIQAPIPGRPLVGIFVPFKKNR